MSPIGLKSDIPSALWTRSVKRDPFFVPSRPFKNAFIPSRPIQISSRPKSVTLEKFSSDQSPSDNFWSDQNPSDNAAVESYVYLPSALKESAKYAYQGIQMRIFFKVSNPMQLRAFSDIFSCLPEHRFGNPRISKNPSSCITWCFRSDFRRNHINRFVNFF